MNVKPLFCVYLSAIFTLFSQFSFSQSPGVSAPGESFSPVLFESGQGEVPQVGEWTRTAGPDESIVFTGHRLSSFSGVEEGKDSRFMVYGTGGVKKEGKIQRLDGQKAIVTLDHALPSWSMYLLQPGNDAGWGKAVAINKTEAWWAQNKVAAGMISSLYGRNLAHGNVEGTSNSHVYIKALGSGSGQWAEVVKVNPYKIEYRVPSSVGEGQYELWVHNGHGGEWGWSAPVVVTVVQSAEHIQTKVWSGATINVKDYGARGDGQGDDRTAINAALLAAGSSGATLYFPSGTYMVSGQLNLRSNTRWLGEVNGEGKPTSMIKLRGGFASGEFGLMGGNDVNLVLFKNIAIDRNYQNLGGRELMDFRSGSMLWWDNCELEVREENVFRLAASSRHIYITATTITGGKDQWGSPLFLDGVRQFFFSGSTIRMTKDCGAAINNKAVVEASMENCLVKDLDNSTTDGSGWGKGRIWSHIGAGGAAYHCYFSANTGTGLGVRQSGSNVPDGNSGEVFLWEANGTMYSGVPSSSTANTISFGGSSIPQDRGELCLAVIKGKGLGQFRRIVSNSGGVLTLDRPWEVQPDGSSMVVVGPYVEKIVLYKNQLDAKGKSYIANNGFEQATASAGIVPYGGCFDFVADGNTIEGLRKGLSTWGTQHHVSIDPTYFCLYTNNKITACRVGMHHAGEITEVEGMAMLGITYRHNRVESPVLTAIHSDFKVENQAVLSAVVYEHNRYSNTPSAFTTGYLGNPDPRANYGAGAIENQIFYKNNFQGGDRGIKITPKIMLRENLYQGLSSPYHGSLPSVAMVEAPYHVVEIMAKPGEEVVKTPFTLVNAGTTPMTWTATTSAPWLKLSTNNGVIDHEGENNTIELSADPKGIKEGIYPTDIIINSSSAQSEIYTIVLKIGNSAVQPTAPTVNLTSPTSGSNFTTPATINLTAIALDADGTVSKVEFYNGSVKIGESATSPYSFQWSGVAAGTYSITAKAIDNGGLSTMSQAINITVSANVASNLAPTVNLTSPTSGSNFTTPATINLTAIALDADGTVSKVEFYNGSVKIGESATSPYSFQWSGVASGTYSITAKAIDNGGLSTMSQEANVSVNVASNLAPTVSLTSPTSGSNFTTPATINLTAIALDADGTVSKVEFYNGSVKIGESATSPYSFQWSGVASGTYSITAKAIDNGGLSTMSQEANVSVNVASNLAPTVSLTSPTSGSNFTTPATINLTAIALDADGTVSKVEFYNGSVKIGESATSPYSFQWSGVASGTYSITAKAIDNGGLSTMSQAINITVSANVANIAPAIALTSPTSGSNFTTPATINLTAIALDADGTVSKVEFYNGSVKIGESATSPYSFQWSGVASGTYSITAKAIDNGGLSTMSQAINITVSANVANIAPAIALTSPTSGSNFTTPATINLTAIALDADGTVSKVEFYNGSVKIGESATSPYSFQWSGVAAGTYSITAKAIDNGGLSTMSQEANVSVNVASNLAPTVSLTSPTSGSNFTTPATINLTAIALDADGTVSKVEFYNGSVKIGESATSPYSFQWSGVASGTYSITAKAIDNGGLSTMSQAINITVSANVANIAPAIALTSPTSGSNFTTPATINLTAIALDADGTVSKVEFYNGSVKIGESATSPYSFQWSGVASGTYSITAKAIDNGGLSTMSQEANVSVNVASNLAPTVSLTSPTSGSNFTTPATINLTAIALDADGTVSKVEFYNGSVKIGESATSPYSFQWSGVASGTYSITAKAIDNGGLSTMSQAINITVSANVANIAPAIALTSPTSGSNFTTPATINLTAIALDADGTVSKVEFYNGSVKIGESATSPYSFQWSGVASGTYSITAKAIDNGGLSTMSQTVVVFVVSQPVLPTVSLISLTRGEFTTPANIILTAAASDADGSISKVEFFVGSTKIGEATNAPYTVTWNNVQAGTFFVVAWATDNSGLMAVSQPMEVIVNKPNESPTITITSPTVANAIFVAPASVTFNTNAFDADGSIVKVEFFNGNDKIGEANDKPYNFTWAGVKAGTYNITAKATDNKGATTTSSALNVIVSDPGKLRNYPNPVISNTTFEFSLPRQSYVELQIFNVHGVMVATPFKGIVETGIVKQIDFDSAGLPSGTYFCRLIYNDGISFFKEWLETKMIKIN